MKFTKEDLIIFYTKNKIAFWFAITMFIFFLIQEIISIKEISFNSISRILLSSLGAGFLSGFLLNFIVSLFKKPTNNVN